LADGRGRRTAIQRRCHAVAGETESALSVLITNEQPERVKLLEPDYVREAARRGVLAHVVDTGPEELQSAIDIAALSEEKSVAMIEGIAKDIG
jgi:hypothetical protein